MWYHKNEAACGQSTLWTVNNHLIISHQFQFSKMYHWFKFYHVVANGNEVCVSRDGFRNIWITHDGSIRFVSKQSCWRFWIMCLQTKLSSLFFLSWTTRTLWGLKFQLNSGFQLWMQCPMIMTATNNVFFGGKNRGAVVGGKKILLQVPKASNHHLLAQESTNIRSPSVDWFSSLNPATLPGFPLRFKLVLWAVKMSSYAVVSSHHTPKSKRLTWKKSWDFSLLRGQREEELL